MGTNELSNELWRQRQLLETMLYKFHIERLLIGSGFTRWIPQATSDVETVVNRLKTAELSLAVEMVDVAREYAPAR